MKKKKKKRVGKTHSSTFSESLVTLRPAASIIGRVRSMLNDSMQTLSFARDSINNGS